KMVSAIVSQRRSSPVATFQRRARMPSKISESRAKTTQETSSSPLGRIRLMRTTTGASAAREKTIAQGTFRFQFNCIFITSIPFASHSVQEPPGLPEKHLGDERPG